jgi:spore maturation protein SpmA
MNEYVEQVVDRFIYEITDHLFLSIEKDDELMREYILNVGNYGLDNLNRAIGKKIKEKLSLENGEENNNPKSRLIKSYTRHTK